MVIYNRTEVINEQNCLSTGSTLLNLALTGRPEAGLLKGKYYYIVGDSSSGKTFLTLTMLAEACKNRAFDEYRLIYDDVEGGALMSVEEFFGTKLAERLEPPAGSRSEPKYSELVEEFYCHLYDAFNRQIPFIYVLDSQDALDSLFSRKKFKKLKNSLESGKVIKGDYGDGKAKIHSTRLREVMQMLRNTDSILIIVNQTRDVLDAMPFGPKSQASGGRALKFYASAQIWLTVKGRIFKTVNKAKRQIGVQVNASVKKNRLSGKEWSVEIPVFFSYGIDDIGSCIDFLVKESFWPKKGDRIKAKDFDNLIGSREEIISMIEENNLQSELISITADAFAEIENKCKLTRKKRYE